MSARDLAAPVAGLTPDHVLVLRTCTADMLSPSPDANRFRWPASGPVEAPDWSPAPRCGRGLHGLLWGEGDGMQLTWEPDAKWLVVRVARADIVDLQGKVKFPRGEVVCCGDRDAATRYLIANGGLGHAIAGAALTAGDRGTATAGDGGAVAVRWWDPSAERWRVAFGEVAGLKSAPGDLKPKTPYHVVDGKLVEKVEVKS